MKFSSFERVLRLKQAHSPEDAWAADGCLWTFSVLAQDQAIQLCPVPQAAVRAAGQMFPPVYLAVSVPLYLRVLCG